MSAQSALSACKRLLQLAAASLLLLAAATLQAASPPTCLPLHYQVLAPHPLLHALTTQLAANSAIGVQRVAPDRLPASRQPSYFGGRGRDALQQAALQADAIITLRSIWPDDHTWPLARQANIRMIEIDAATPIEGEPAGIALPHNQNGVAAIASRPWLQSANMARMASLIGHALMRLYPGQRTSLQANLNDMQQRLQKLDFETTRALAQVPNPAVLNLSERLDFFVRALQLENNPWQADANDTPAEQAQKLQQHLQQAQIAVVLHDKKPAPDLAQAIAAAPAQLVIIQRTQADPIGELESATRAVVAALQQAGPAP